MIEWGRTLVARWRERRERNELVSLIRQSVAGMQAEAARLQGVWHCMLCGQEGAAPDERTLSLELRGNALWRQYDCPACGRRGYELGGDPPLPVPEDYPVHEYGRGGRCPKCGSEDTIPIMYGLPSEQGFLAASRGQVRLGGCIIIDGPDGEPGPDAVCKQCGAKWARVTKGASAY